MDMEISKKLDKFFYGYKSKKYKRHEILLKPNSEPTGAFYLTEGVVRQYAITANGDEVTINVFKPKSFFPTGWLVNDSMSAHFFEAVSPVTVWIAPKKKVIEFFKNDSLILLDLVRRIYKGLDGYFMRMESMMTGSAQARLITEILINARRFGTLLDGETHVNLRITEKDLAAGSGIARETVSREIKKLKKKTLINFQKNKFIIPSVQLLEEELLNLYK
jgi:CRP-like cAMP-binding protein